MSKENNEFGIFILGFVLGAGVLAMILLACGVFSNSYLAQDKDELADIHIKHYYPEYNNCSIIYKEAKEIECEWGTDGAFVYCDENANRDGMSNLGTKHETICFDDIKLRDIYKNKLNYYYN